MFMIWFGAIVIIIGIIYVIFDGKMDNFKFTRLKSSSKYTYRQYGFIFILIGIIALCIGLYDYESHKYLNNLKTQLGI